MKVRILYPGQDFVSLLIAAVLIFVSASVQAGSDEWEMRQAAKAGDIKKIQELLEDGANIDGQSRKGYSPVHLAAMKGHLEAVELLIKEEADVNNVSVKGTTPLMSATYRSYTAIAQALLAAGADTKPRSNNGNTALDLAFKYDDLASAYLIEYGDVSNSVNLAVPKSMALTAEKFRRAVRFALNGRGWTVDKETDNRVDATIFKHGRKFKVAVQWNDDHISIRFYPTTGRRG